MWCAEQAPCALMMHAIFCTGHSDVSTDAQFCTASAKRIAAYSRRGRPSRSLGNSPPYTRFASITFGSPPNACCSNSRNARRIVLDLRTSVRPHITHCHGGQFPGMQIWRERTRSSELIVGHQRAGCKSGRRSILAFIMSRGVTPISSNSSPICTLFGAISVHRSLRPFPRLVVATIIFARLRNHAR